MTDSIVFDDDIILIWNKFPTSIRNDPCFSAFREEFEGAHGNLLDNIIDCIDIFHEIFASFTQQKHLQHKMSY